MKTSELKETCSVFTNMIKENKLRPITGFVEIYSKDGVAHLGVTDNRTTVVATLNNKNDIDNAVVSLHDLYKLVKLTTKSEVTITNKDKYIEFKGNGKYKIPLQPDEMGNDIYLPLEMPAMGENIVEYDSKDFQLALERNKVGLFTEDSHDEFKLYYNKEGNLVTSDSVIVAYTRNINLPLGNIQAFVVEQLSNFDGTLKFSEVDEGYRISYNNYEIYMVNKLYDEFPIDMVEPFLEEEKSEDMFPNKSRVNKNLLFTAIKRQDIFRTPYDGPSVIFVIEDDNIVIKNRGKTVDEMLETTDKQYKNPMTVEVETSILINVLKNMEDELDLYIGEQAICLNDTKGFYVISVIETE